MISVIVPTMWKYEPFLDFVKELAKVSSVGEIIIINNDKTKTPDHVALNNPKVKLHDCERNIYVNPAWNLGVQLSSFDKLCIMNDDVIVDLKLFDRIEHCLTDQVGVVGICPGRPEFGQPPFRDGSIDISVWTGQHSFGFGSLFFIHKNNWIDIPSDLEVYYGDNWIFDIQLFVKRKNNFIISNCFFFSPWAQTTSTISTNEWMEREGPIYQNIKRILISHKA